MRPAQSACLDEGVAAAAWARCGGDRVLADLYAEDHHGALAATCFWLHMDMLARGRATVWVLLTRQLHRASHAQMHAWTLSCCIGLPCMPYACAAEMQEIVMFSQAQLYIIPAGC